MGQAFSETRCQGFSQHRLVIEVRLQESFTDSVVQLFNLRVDLQSCNFKKQFAGQGVAVGVEPR